MRSYGEARNALASDSLKVLQTTARERRNVFEQLIEAVKYNLLGQISHALYEVGVPEEYVTPISTHKRVRKHQSANAVTDAYLRLQ